MAASKISAKSPAASDNNSFPSTSSASSQSGRDASATAAYERYFRLPELAKLAGSREFPQWRNEAVLKPALQGLEITFRFVSLSLSDPRPYANHRQWKRRLESLASREIELIAALCEEGGGAGAPVADLSLCAGVLSRKYSSQEVWKAPGEAASVVARTSEASLLPRLAAWEKSEDVAAKILFQIESHMQGCAFTLGLGEPNLAGKPTLEYDLVVRPLDLHILKRCSKADQEDQVLCTIHQILESWLSAARELLARVEQRIEAEDWAAAASDCWLMERIWKLLSDVEDLHLLMDPDDFLRLKSQLVIKAASGGEEAACFRSEALMHVTGTFKELRQSVPRILGVEADPNGGPRVQNAAMNLFHSRRRGEGEEAGKVELLQAMQAVEAALKRFFFAYRQVATAVMGNLEVIGNRAVYVPAESLDPLTQMFLEPPYYPSLDAAKTFLGEYWRQSDFGGVPPSSDLCVSRVENDPKRYNDGYSKLRSLAYNSLDLYKHELLSVLYPVYIHCFMDLVAGGLVHEARIFFFAFREDHESRHLRDLQKLERILSTLNSEEMELARSFRLNKLKIKLCEYSYDLLLQYLQKTHTLTILGIINEHIDFEVYPGQPTTVADNADFATAEGRNNKFGKQMNQNIRWGALEETEEQHPEKALSDSEKAENGNKDVNTEKGKQGVAVRRIKKDKLVSATGANARSETSAVSAAPRMKPELTLPATPAEVERVVLEDLRNRVQLNSLALPSINFYTILNAHDRLNCLSVSEGGSLIAGGFSDSSVKVWDMSEDVQIKKTFNLLGANESVKNENIPGTEDCKRSYTLLHGHSGPVYSVAFSHSGDFLLSASSDSTIRLWNTKLNANLVCYKGHNFPVWDAQFNPVGDYFASCSHDRTARIWSMERTHPVRVLAGHLSDVDCVQWHANCNYIATGSSDKTIRLWDVHNGDSVRIFIGHRSMILSLAMSPDGRYMASGDEDGTIMMWDISSGCCVSPLVGHNSCVWSLAFSCEGTLLASGSADSTVKLWDVTASTKAPRTENKSSCSHRLRLLKALPTKSTPVYTLQFSRRNLLFAAGAPSRCS